MGAVSLNSEAGTGPWVRSLLDIYCYAARPARRWKAAIQLELKGDVDQRFAAVGGALMSGFTERRDVGASVAVVLDGELVVDLWSGYRDRGRSQAWERDTLVCGFSMTKGVTALCVLQAVAEGLIELDLPVASIWPEFGNQGKEKITPRHLLTHQAGLCGLHEPAEKDLYYDWPAMIMALEREYPWWEPGTRHGYHARTFGFLLGELLIRASGRSVGAWLKEHIAQPFCLDFHIGLNQSDLPRCAQILPARVRAGDAASGGMMADFNDISTPTGAAFQNPSLGPGYMNSERFRRCEMPAMNGHGTARSLARLYGMIEELLPADLFREATATHSLGEDLVLKSLTHFGLGFMLHHQQAPIGVG